MTRSPKETDQALSQLSRRHQQYYEVEVHVDATPEQADRLRSVVDRLIAAADEIKQLAVDLDESGCHMMAEDTWGLYCDVVYYLDGPIGPTSAAPERVAGILDGSYRSE